MAEFSVIYTEEALQDMLNISDYHFEKVGEASALRAVAELQDHIEKLSLFPRMGGGTSRPLLECPGIPKGGS